MTINNISTPNEANDVIEGLVVFWQLYFPLFITMFGLLGNILTYLTMNQSDKKGLVMPHHFRTLAIFDSLTLILDLFQYWLWINFPSFVAIQGDIFCVEYIFTAYVTFAMASWTLVIMSLDRLVATMFPLHAATWCTIRKARIFNVCNVLINSALCFPRLFRYFNLQGVSIGSLHAMCPVSSFLPEWVGGFLDVSYVITANYTPPILVLIMNVLILLSLRKHAKQQQNLGQTDAKEDKSIIAMLLIVAFTYTLASAAYPLDMFIWEIFYPNLASEKPRLRHLSFAIGYNITCLNNGINFYLYCIASAGFRNDLKKLFRSKR